MESIKNITCGFLHGLYDSIAGMTLLLTIDAEIEYQEEREKELEKIEREREIRKRSPSPTPSSASAYEREEREKEARQQSASSPFGHQANADERTLESMRQSAKPKEQPKPKREKKIAKKVLKCCLLNGGFTWLSIILFEYVLLPMLKFVLGLFYGEKSDDLHYVWGWLPTVLSIIFSMMWVLPIFLLSKVVSSLWFADIANAAYQVKKGRPQLIPGFSRLIADFLFSLIVQAIFLVQSMAVALFPYLHIGTFLSFIHLSMLYSLYAFEYKWFNMGWELHRRLTYIEDNWPYFLGFGVPLTILTSMTNSVIVSGCIFSMFFPLFILSGNEARPIIGTTDVPLRLFMPTVFVSNLFFSRSEDRKRIMAAQQAKQRLLQQRELYERQMRQQRQQLPPKPILTLEERFQLHQMQEEHLRQLARRSSSNNKIREKQQQQQKNKHSPTSSVASSTDSTYRYQQPPPFPKQQQHQQQRSNAAAQESVRTTATNQDFVGMRPLIPTPVHYAASSSTASSSAQK